MLGLRPIAAAAICALPDYLLNTPAGAFIGTATYEAVARSAYQQLVSTEIKLAYTVEISIRAVR